MTAVFEALASHTPLSGLRSLGVCELMSQEWQLLTEADNLRQLEMLDVSDSTFSAADARRLALSPLSQTLRELKLDVRILYSDSVRELVSVSWPELRSLTLEVNVETDEEAVQNLVTSGSFPRLHTFVLRNFTDPMLQAFSQTSALPELRVLDARKGNATNDTVRSIFRSSHLPHIQLLRIVGAKGLYASQLKKEFGWRFNQGGLLVESMMRPV